VYVKSWLLGKRELFEFRFSTIKRLMEPIGWNMGVLVHSVQMCFRAHDLCRCFNISFCVEPGGLIVVNFGGKTSFGRKE
jgi:hypothetical protein